MSIIESANGVGARLAEARSDQGLSVEDLSSRTYIRPGVIRGIENDDFAACGGTFYARGHIRTLAHTLGIDEAPLIEQFDRSNGAPEAHLTPERTSVEPVSRRAPRAVRVPRAARAPRSRAAGGGPGWMAVATVVLIVICLVALVSLLLGGPSNKGGAPAAKTPEPVKTSAAAPSAAAPAPAPSFSGVNLDVRLTNGSSWVKVTDESGRVLSADVKQQGASAQFRGAQQLRYTFGNAAAVTVTCNGKDMGSLGGDGQVVSRVVALGDPACGPASG